MSEEYPLEALLDIRERERDEAERALAREMAELERRQQTVKKRTAELEDIRGRKKSAREEADAAMSDGMSIAQMGMHDEYVRGLDIEEASARERVDDAMQNVARQRRTVEKARAALEHAQKELLAVEKHHENWQQEEAIIARRKASNEMDEIAMRLWQKENS